jgi:FkbM family methyltransferase
MQKIAFIIAATEYGPMILNRFDYLINVQRQTVQGIGASLLEIGTYGKDEVTFYNSLLDLRHRYFGSDVQVIDCGANIGTITIGLATHIRDYGNVLAIEAQERLFYCLAGNIVIGNHHNARAIWAAVGDHDGIMSIPKIDYLQQASYGSIELQKCENNEPVGQHISYDSALSQVSIITIDSLNLHRLDFLKIDVERMELAVLQGAKETIARLHPILAIEYIKVGIDPIADWLREAGYTHYIISGMMVIAIHPDDPVFNHIELTDEVSE